MNQFVINNVMKTKASVVVQSVKNIEETSWQENFEKGGKSLLTLKEKATLNRISVPVHT
jgi:hypothetical protein